MRPAVHEDLERQEAHEPGSDRAFGLVFAAVAALAALAPLLRGGELRWSAAAVGGIFLVLALAAPVLLHPLNLLWHRLGLLLRRVMEPLVLGAVFYGCLTPLGVVQRLMGRDGLRLRAKPDAATYWIARDQPGPPAETMRNQF
ncbi:MAG TPA: SxtJ family membrane protein [Stellaceae bacterium]|nr:SxtJ family membrane protein [Stellaceae bacterium]